MKYLKKHFLLPIVLVGFILSFSKCSQEVVLDFQEPVDDSKPVVFKEKLSDYNFFTGNIADFNPAENVFKYELATPLFSDYTVKERFIYLREGTSLTYRDSGIVEFPAGAIIIKNFSSLNTNNSLKRLETRLLLKDPFNDRWKVMSYLWNSDQSDAIRHISGDNVDITIEDESGNRLQTNYRIPNLNECKLCHSTEGRIAPIGPKIRSMNYSVNGVNQLDLWKDKGLLKDLPVSNVPQLPDWQNTADFTLDERARAYLDINCAHCHSNAGDASYTGLWLEYEQTDSSRLGFYKTPIAAGPGSGSLSYDIVPGDAERSIIHFRMNSAEVGVAMPELARSMVHEKGVELIKEWIDSF